MSFLDHPEKWDDWPGNGPGLSSEERRIIGKSRRKEVPRSQIARWSQPSGRPDPVLVIEENWKRSSPFAMRAVHKVMTKDPEDFILASFQQMAYDLANSPSSGINTLIYGDCTLQGFNATVYPDESVIISLFHPEQMVYAPFEWDLKRLAISCSFFFKKFGLSGRMREIILRDMLNSYREEIHRCSGISFIKFFSHELDLSGLLSEQGDQKIFRRRAFLLKRIRNLISKYSLNSYLSREDGFLFLRGFHSDSGFEQISLETREEIIKILSEYICNISKKSKTILKRYVLRDIVKGSVPLHNPNSPCYYALFQASEDDSLLLQIQQVFPSVFSPFVHMGVQTDEEGFVPGYPFNNLIDNLLIGHASDADKKTYVIRHIRPSISPAIFLDDSGDLAEFAKICAMYLARLHAHSADPCVIDGYIGKGSSFIQAILSFVSLYENQVLRDYHQYLESIKMMKHEEISGILNPG